MVLHNFCSHELVFFLKSIKVELRLNFETEGATVEEGSKKGWEKEHFCKAHANLGSG